MEKKKERSRCYVSSDSYRRSKEHAASVDRQINGPTPYTFCYGGFTDFVGYEAFMKDLHAAFDCQVDVKIAPETTNPYETSTRIQSICAGCDMVSACDYSQSLEMAWEINLIMHGILKCPHCGQPISPIRKIPKTLLKIHDVRLNGHPARLNISKTRQWYCNNCKKSISATRIPGIQSVKGGELTLRLLRSVFELSISGVPNGFISEGYDLNRDYVGELCRQFMSRTESEYLKRRNEILANMPAGDFYDEPVLLGGKKYRAIFSKEKDKFYTILPESDILAALHGYTQGVPDQIVKYSQREAVSLYAFSFVEPMRRKILSGLFKIMQAAQVECRKLQPINLPDLPKEISHWIKIALDDDNLDLRNLHDFLTDKDLFQAVHKMSSKGTRLYRTQKTAGDLAEYINQILTDRSEAWLAESTSAHKDIRLSHLRKFLHSIQKDTKDSIRLTAVTIMEHEFERSEYPYTERFRRLQFYNEPALLSNQRNTLPIIMEEGSGMPYLEYSQLGYGFPTACLEHLLRTGLLKRNSYGMKCFHHRKNGMVGCCTLECPFLK